MHTHTRDLANRFEKQPHFAFCITQFQIWRRQGASAAIVVVATAANASAFWLISVYYRCNACCVPLAILFTAPCCIIFISVYVYVCVRKIHYIIASVGVKCILQSGMHIFHTSARPTILLENSIHSRLFMVICSAALHLGKFIAHVAVKCGLWTFFIHHTYINYRAQALMQPEPIYGNRYRPRRAAFPAFVMTAMTLDSSYEWKYFSYFKRIVPYSLLGNMFFRLCWSDANIWE